MLIYLISIKIAQEIQINLNRPRVKRKVFHKSILSSEQYGFLCLRSIYYVIFTNSKVPPFFPSLTYMNIKSCWFPRCPPHPHPTGSTECGPGTPPAGRGLLLNPVLSSATPLSHPPADFSSVKGNQNYIKIAHSNWNIYLFSQHHFFCQKIFFRGLSKRRG